MEHETQQAEGHRVLVSTFMKLTHGTLQGSQNLDHGSAGGRETDNNSLLHYEGGWKKPEEKNNKPSTENYLISLE